MNSDQSLANKNHSPDEAPVRSPVQFSDWAEAFDSLEVAISIISNEFQLEYVNAAYRKIVGIPENIGVGSSARELYTYLAERGDFGDGDARQLADERLNALEQGEWNDGVQEMADGKSINIRRSRTDEGFLITTITDITGVRNSEALVGMVLDATDQAILIVDQRGVVQLLNKAFMQVFDLKDTLVPNSHTFVSLMQIAWHNQVFTGDFFGDDVNAINEQEFIRRTEKYSELSMQEPLTIRLSSGEYLRFSSRQFANQYRILTFTNITDGIEREIAIHRAKKFSENALSDFRTALNNLDVGLVLFDEELNALIINLAFHRIWETDEHDLPEGANFLTLMQYNKANQVFDIAESDWDDYVEMRLEELKSGNAEPREITIANGRTLNYSCSALSNGMRLLSYSDITEFKNRESELKLAQRRAESADRSKSEFLANMSHEIRTPMNGVIGMAELLGNTALNAKQKIFTDTILSSSNALLTIINDILDFSKIDSGKLTLDFSSFSLRDALEDVAVVVGANCGDSDIELIVRVQPDLSDNVVGDAGRFRQILSNLLGNAMKFTEEGYVLVNISGEVVDDKLSLECFVQDTGIGIPEDQMSNVFEKFSQVDGSSTRRHEGTGLGLAIASRLVELMGGRMGCYSQLGEGSTFWFTLDLQQGAKTLSELTLPQDITGTRILAIDDNAVNRSILLEQFEAWNLNGHVAPSGAEGLTMLRQAAREGNAYRAVILDYHMPDMNGIAVAEHIRNDTQLCETAIIMLTSVDNISDNAVLRKLGLDAHLTKPARASQLLENIIRVISKCEPTNDDKTSTDEMTMKGGEPTVKIIATQQEEGMPSTRILVVEDNEVNQIVFTQILIHMGVDFQLVGNGKLALEAIEHYRPQLVLMDVSMPVMNGLDATRELRKLYSGGAAHDNYRPIIIGITAHALKEDKNLCLAAGMDDYLSKPVSPDLLIEKILHWLPEDKLDFQQKENA